jgi:hypothetical protein
MGERYHVLYFDCVQQWDPQEGCNYDNLALSFLSGILWGEEIGWRNAGIFHAALQRQNTEISKQKFPEKEYRGLSPNFHIHVPVSE